MTTRGKLFQNPSAVFCSPENLVLECQMTLTIHIQNDNSRRKIYHPGDNIKGTLCLTGPLRNNSFELYVTVNGKTRVEIEEYDREGSGKTHTYRKNTKLFSIKQLLFEGKCHLDNNQTRTWDFDFWLPSRGVPPSFYFDSTSPRRDGVKAEIYYYLQASAHKVNFFRDEPKTILPLCIQPQRGPRAKPEYEGATKLVNSKSSLWKKTKMFCRRIRRKLPGCKSNPEVHELKSIINLTAILPSTIGLGEAHTLSFEFTNNISTEAPVAAFKILKLKHKIICETTFRANGTSDKRHKDVWRFKRKDGLPFVEAGKRTAIALKGIEPLETVSFQTASINRRYWSRTTVKVDFGGERRTVRFDVPILKVIPQMNPASTD